MANDETMTKLEARMNLYAAIFVILISSFVITATAQDTEPPKKKGIQLQFIPPPMEGTVSLGIYDAAGKLVRILHQEAHENEFFPALNGLITYWDGNDDSGKAMPAGKYRARGYMVGAMDFEGVGFIGNDFIANDSAPRYRRILKFEAMGILMLRGETASHELVTWVTDLQGNEQNYPGKEKYPRDADWITDTCIGVKEGKVLTLKTPAEWMELKLPDLTWAVDAWPAHDKDEAFWVIDYKQAGCEIKEYGRSGEILRRLTINEGEPKPWIIRAEPNADRIFLLEGSGQLQRLRGLELVSTEKTGEPGQPLKSTWKVIYSKTITFSDTIDQVREQLKMPDGKPFVPQEKIRLTLLPNPLEQDKPGAVDISVGIDAKGSFLKAGDGLPLCRVSETANLKWAAMAREPGSKAVIIFQGDGAVVEEFKAGKLANMVAFDCGDFLFDPAKIK